MERKKYALCDLLFPRGGCSLRRGALAVGCTCAGDGHERRAVRGNRGVPADFSDRRHPHGRLSRHGGRTLVAPDVREKARDHEGCQLRRVRGHLRRRVPARLRGLCLRGVRRGAYFADLPAVRALSRAVGPVRGESAECAKVRHALRLHKRRPAPHGDSRAHARRPRRRGGDGLDVSHGWRDGGGVCGGFRAQVSQIRAGTVWRRDRGHVGLLFAALRALRPDRRLDRRAAVIDIFFIRHGATEGNLRRRYIGRTDEPLCEAGIAQVKALQKRGLSVDRLFVSPMLRTRQTADILFPKMHYTVVDGLIETDFGRFEGKSADKLSGDPAYQAWVDAMCLTPIPEGESVTDFKTRCCEAFAETIKNVPDGSRVGFVVHGGVIMAIMEAYARPKKDFYAYHIGNGECLQGVYDGETIQIK